MYALTAVLMFFWLTFTILMILSPKHRLVFAMLSIISSMVLAVVTTSIDVPYEFLFENAIDNSIRVVTGTHSVESARYMSPFFFGMMWFAFAWAAIIIAERLTGKKMITGEDA